MIIRNPFKILLLSLIIFFFSCSKKEIIPQEVQVNDFVWGGLNAFYKWQSNIPDLSDRRFSTRSQLNSYLAGYEDPKTLFENLLYKPTDRFSWIVDDYIALENAFKGIRLTSGIKLKSANFLDNSGGFYVYVTDVVENSDADSKGIKRGMIITEINGTTLTKDNVNTLFDNTSFTIHLADYNNGNPVTNGTIISLTKTNVQENPIKVAKVITSGTKKIGYLLYNQFASIYDQQLNKAFGNFKSAGITDLIVDLRYNGGGSVRSAVYLGSMITGQFTGELFSKQVWNEKVMNNVAKINSEQFIDRFTDKIVKRNDKGNTINETINSLKLSTVYFIVSENTASASELVINSLEPYISVKLIGTKTYGKHVGSITLYDSDDYTKGGKNFNTGHNWAMQPITFEIQNKDGNNKPQGFTPTIKIIEDPQNTGILGEPNEPLLKKAILYVTSGAKGATLSTSNQIGAQWNSNMLFADYNNMYAEW